MNLSHLKKLAKVNSSYVNLQSTEVISRKGTDVFAIYTPPEKIFDKEFSVYNFTEFLNLIQTFKDVVLEFKGEKIIIKDASNGAYITYVTVAPSLMAEHITRDKKGKRLCEIASNLKSIKPTVKFQLTNDDISTLVRMGNTFKTGDAPAKITFSKSAGNNEVNINVKCDQSENSYDTKKTGIHPLDSDGIAPEQRLIFSNEVKGIQPFSYSINMDSLLPGNWNCYIFETDGFDSKIKRPFISVENEKIPAIFMYLENEEEHMKMIITYIQDKRTPENKE